MKILGFNINISREAQPHSKRSMSLSPIMDFLRGGSGECSGPVMSNAYQQVAWVYRAVNALAEQVANVPFLFSRGGRGREQLITSGPLLDFYGRPHPQISQFEYWELRVIWLMLRGECFRVPIYESSSFSSSSSGVSLVNDDGERQDSITRTSTRTRTSELHASALPRSNARRLSRVLILDPARFQ